MPTNVLIDLFGFSKRIDPLKYFKILVITSSSLTMPLPLDGSTIFILRISILSRSFKLVSPSILLVSTKQVQPPLPFSVLDAITNKSAGIASVSFT